jgi:hypothetical protein
MSLCSIDLIVHDDPTGVVAKGYSYEPTFEYIQTADFNRDAAFVSAYGVAPDLDGGLGAPRSPRT